jgi:hypothetical protein
MSMSVSVSESESERVRVYNKEVLTPYFVCSVLGQIFKKFDIIFACKPYG